MDFARFFLKKGEEREIRQGFLWAFDNEIERVKFFDGKEWKDAPFAEIVSEGKVKDGECVEIFSSAGGFLGSGIFNSKSKIAVRIVSDSHADKIFEDKAGFIFKKICDAYNLRRIHFSDEDSFRVCFDEADLLPGLTVERYFSEDKKIYLVVQFLALAAEVFRNEILSALEKVLKPFAIYERSDADVREKEGLEKKSGWLGRRGKEEIVILENGVRISVDLARGQKTGYFLDQKLNRAEIARYCHGKNVLDTFCHTGAFGLNAFKAGAKSVICADISSDAVEIAKKNIELNGAEKIVKTVCADVFELLRQYESDGKKFDVIILDPPAFTKSARAVKKAYGGYKEINLRAMRILNPGGILVTCSCSYFFDPNAFYSMLANAATDSHRRVQVLQKRGAAFDHPVLLGYPRSEYLCCAICKVF
ncbi:MAG: class I SAM-dependent rRNA methyltransferase [Treponemataceae bacterium]|nr:class I SAM-dependent rRNA methyltransferase [Treponemataceae bacterium]